MVTVVYYLTVKFPTPTGIGFVRADLGKARQCKVRAIELTQNVPSRPSVKEIKSNNANQIPLDELNHREEFLKSEPVGDTTPVPLCDEIVEKITQMGRANY